MKRDRKEPLYRKVNTKARGVWHHKGSDAKYDRNTKKGLASSLKQGIQRGLDYTPLYRFLLSKVGKSWDDVYSEAVSRLDKEEPIFYMVDLNTEHENPIYPSDYTNIGESGKWSKLIVDDNGILQLKNPNLKNEDFYPSCHCCTHTFNGVVLNHTYEDHVKRLSILNIDN